MRSKNTFRYLSGAVLANEAGNGLIFFIKHKPLNNFRIKKRTGYTVPLI